ncbi:hypothetical protein [Variovorax rhizosphaerae]|uniref:Chloramphenicol acetyltransferase n=1 Tax=Variovorax rhizosphaerae TaxID=1836200 RepID=A0ABU8WLR8_9BURK
MEKKVEILQGIAWWDWPIEKVTRKLAAIVSGDVAALQAGALEA